LGGGNTAVGYQALALNDTGTNNTAIGINAESHDINGSNNVAIGREALFSNNGGFQNVGIGWDALQNNVTGFDNIAIGSSAGHFITGNDNIDIGSSGVAGESGVTRIGSGIQSKTFISAIRGVTTDNANAIPVLIDTAGQLGTLSSSRRFKRDIKPMERTSESILALKPVTFHYRSDKTSTPQFGLIAEQVADVNPDLVVRDEKGEIYTVRYDAVNAMLLNEFLKEHKAFLEEQSKVQKLEAALAAMNSRLKEQDAKIEKVSAQLKASTATPQIVSNQ
jgi:hypothetical protein